MIAYSAESGGKELGMRYTGNWRHSSTYIAALAPSRTLGSWQPYGGMPPAWTGDAKSAVAVLDNCAGRNEAKLMNSHSCGLLGAALV